MTDGLPHIRLGGAGISVAIAIAASAPALANDYAYEAGQNREFGVIDLGSGVFTRCGISPDLVSGFGVGPDRQLYAGSYEGNNFYSVIPTPDEADSLGHSPLR